MSSTQFKYPLASKQSKAFAMACKGKRQKEARQQTFIMSSWDRK